MGEDNHLSICSFFMLLWRHGRPDFCENVVVLPQQASRETIIAAR
jgi:hypothetical protein